jgi:hypothetical protein
LKSTKIWVPPALSLGWALGGSKMKYVKTGNISVDGKGVKKAKISPQSPKTEFGLKNQYGFVSKSDS